MVDPDPNSFWDCLLRHRAELEAEPSPGDVMDDLLSVLQILDSRLSYHLGIHDRGIDGCYQVT